MSDSYKARLRYIALTRILGSGTKPIIDPVTPRKDQQNWTDFTFGQECTIAPARLGGISLHSSDFKHFSYIIATKVLR